ncbi:MAG: Chaperone protein DnaJ [Myxococcota bacterium]|nr:Chaperone protein DnaJ [Myxococcota bacterium]
MSGSDNLYLRGDLSDTYIGIVFARLNRNLATGVLHIVTDDEKTGVVFQSGDPVFIKSSKIMEPLGRILLEMNLINEDQYNKSLIEMVKSKKRQGDVLKDMKLVTELDIAKALETQHRRRLNRLFYLTRGNFHFELTAEPPFPLEPVRVDFMPLLYNGIKNAQKTELILRHADDHAYQLSGDYDLQESSLPLDKAEFTAARKLEKPMTLEQFAASSGLNRAEATLLFGFLLSASLVTDAGAVGSTAQSMAALPPKPAPMHHEAGDIPDLGPIGDAPWLNMDPPAPSSSSFPPVPPPLPAGAHASMPPPPPLPNLGGNPPPPRPATPGVQPYVAPWVPQPPGAPAHPVSQTNMSRAQPNQVRISNPVMPAVTPGTNPNISPPAREQTGSAAPAARHASGTLPAAPGTARPGTTPVKRVLTRSMPAVTDPGAGQPSQTPEDLAKLIDEKMADLDTSHYFDVMEVPVDATEAEIKKAYFTLAKIFHPDRIGRAAPDVQQKVNRIFTRVNEAYAVLIDPKKRVELVEKIRAAQAAAMAPQKPRITQEESLAEIAFQKGDYMLRKGNLEEAFVSIKRALEFLPTHNEYNLGLATVQVRMMEKMGPHDERDHLMFDTELTLKHVLEHNQTEARAHYLLAEVYRMYARDEEAIQHLEIAVQLRPDMTEAVELLTRIRKESAPLTFEEIPETAPMAETKGGGLFSKLKKKIS